LRNYHFFKIVGSSYFGGAKLLVYTIYCFHVCIAIIINCVLVYYYDCWLYKYDDGVEYVYVYMFICLYVYVVMVMVMCDGLINIVLVVNDQPLMNGEVGLWIICDDG